MYRAAAVLRTALVGTTISRFESVGLVGPVAKGSEPKLCFDHPRYCGDPSDGPPGDGFEKWHRGRNGRTRRGS